MISYIGKIAEEIPYVTPDQKSSEVYEIFEDNPLLEGIVVKEEDRPVGIIMKTKFYHKLSSKYGFDVYMGRKVELVMTKNPLIVDYFLPITDVSTHAMSRDQDDLYDYVIVEKNRRFYGIVNIKNLLIKIVEEQVSIARNTNPLTGLPGNTLIEEKLSEIIYLGEFSVLYVDLDHFKAYNDVYGFAKGDQLIKETANILNKYVLLKQREQAFVGHIGGDDFIAILPHYEVDDICQGIIEEFDKSVQHYYDSQDFQRGFITVENRKGTVEETPLCSISIAVINNKIELFKTLDDISEAATKLKKICKLKPSSCYVINTYLDCNCVRNRNCDGLSTKDLDNITV